MPQRNSPISIPSTSPAAVEAQTGAGMTGLSGDMLPTSLRERLRLTSRRLLNVGLPMGTSIQLRLWWPLWLLPIALVNQILAPHPVWVVLLIALSGIYGISYYWVRTQQAGLTMSRQRDGSIVAAGDQLTERFVLDNNSSLPVLWAEFTDLSDMPSYNQSRIVACSSATNYRWQSTLTCNQRGVYHVGPSLITWGDPFGLFTANKWFNDSEQIVIYPRVAHLPRHWLPHGTVGGLRQQPHPLIGSIRSASVREYNPGDSLRYVHWPSTARQRRMMVTELDSDYGGEVWIVVDLNESVQLGEGERSTLEYSIVVAASLAAQLTSSSERLAVGLIFSTGVSSAPTWEDSEISQLMIGQPADARTSVLPDFIPPPPGLLQPGASGLELAPPHNQNPRLEGAMATTSRVAVLPPQPGQAHLWRMLGALATARPSKVPLAQLLRNNRSLLGRRQSVIVITPQISRTISQGELSNSPAGTDSSDSSRSLRHDITDDENWIGELARSHNHRRGTAILIQYDEPPTTQTGGQTLAANQADESTVRQFGENEIDDLRTLLVGNDIACSVMRTGERLPSLLTSRRTRTEIRNTPNGGAVLIEIEEEIG